VNGEVCVFVFANFLSMGTIIANGRKKCKRTDKNMQIKTRNECLCSFFITHSPYCGAHSGSIISIGATARDFQATGGRRVTAVFADEITADAGISRHSVTVIGRSPAHDIIDSLWSGSLAGMTLREITRTIGGKFGIVCDTFPVNKPDPTATVKGFGWENESPWTKFIAEADAQGFILTSNEAGKCAAEKKRGHRLPSGAGGLPARK
jgi:hypothetical protein